MTIQFSDIPGSIRKPGKYFEFNTKLAVRSLPANRQTLLLVGQRTSSGSVAEKIATAVISDTEAATLFGAGSQLHLMARAALLANPYVALYAIALDDADASSAATGTVTISYPASASGTLTLWVGNAHVNVGITSGDTAAEIAAALKDAINAETALPVTAAASDGIVTLTAKNAGTQGNGIGLITETTNSCVATVVAPMAAGEVDPSLAAALAATASEPYDIIACPYNDATSLAALKSHLDTMSGPIEQRPGIGVFGLSGLYADAVTLASGVNSARIVCAYLRDTRSLTCELAAAFASMIAYEEDPARPINTLSLSGIHAPAISSRLTRTEQENCLYNGITPLEVGPGGSPQIVRAVTTYTVDANGVADVSMLDLATIRTLDYVRKACRERIALRFPREKLNAATVKSVRSELLDVLYRLEELEIVENVEANKDYLVVERNGRDANRIDARIPADVVNGLHVVAGRIDLIL